MSKLVLPLILILLLVGCKGADPVQVPTLETGQEHVAKTQIIVQNQTDLVWSENRDAVFQGFIKTLTDYTTAPSMKDFSIKIVLLEDPLAEWVYFNPQIGDREVFKSEQDIPSTLDRSLIKTPIGLATRIEENGKVVGATIRVSVGTLRPKVAVFPEYSLQEAVTFYVFHEMWHVFGFFLNSLGRSSDALMVQNEGFCDSVGNAVMGRAQNHSYQQMLQRSLISYPVDAEVPPIDPKFYEMLPNKGLPFR